MNTYYVYAHAHTLHTRRLAGPSTAEIARVLINRGPLCLIRFPYALSLAAATSRAHTYPRARDRTPRGPPCARPLRGCNAQTRAFIIIVLQCVVFRADRNNCGHRERDKSRKIRAETLYNGWRRKKKRVSFDRARASGAPATCVESDVVGRTRRRLSVNRFRRRLKNRLLPALGGTNVLFRRTGRKHHQRFTRVRGFFSTETYCTTSSYPTSVMCVQRIGRVMCGLNVRSAISPITPRSNKTRYGRPRNVQTCRGFWYRGRQIDCCERGRDRE